MRLLLGTMNLAKIEYYQKYLIHAKLELVTLKDLGIMDVPLEIGDTYLDNALLKAKFYGEKTEYPTIADDGGFEVDALDGRPGIESRRFVGPHGTDEDRITKVLELTKDIPLNERKARFRLVCVVYFPIERDYLTVEKITEGLVTDRPSDRRIDGFPYRSILFLPKYQKNLIDLTPEELEEVDHRKKACKELVIKLEPYLNA